MRWTCGDHTLTLPDSRTLGYATYGDPAGLPVVNCHGGLVSGHDVSPADEAARSLGLCVISPDRPGINRTDRLSGHGLLPWVRADLVPLLNHLEVGSIGVMGWSEGGQYALAAAFELAERVTGCAVIAGCPPLDDPATFKQSNRLDHILVILARRCPMALRLMATCTRLLSTHARECSCGSHYTDNPVPKPMRLASWVGGCPPSWVRVQQILTALSTNTWPSLLHGDSLPRI